MTCFVLYPQMSCQKSGTRNQGQPLISGDQKSEKSGTATYFPSTPDLAGTVYSAQDSSIIVFQSSARTVHSRQAGFAGPYGLYQRSLWVNRWLSPFRRLLVHGDQSPFHWDPGEKRESIPGAVTEVVAGAGHMVHHDQPDALAGVIRQFIRKAVPRNG